MKLLVFLIPFLLAIPYVPTTAISTHTDDVLDNIVNEINTTAVWEGSTFRGWKYRYNSSFGNAEKHYTGYLVGVAGIGDFLRLAADQEISGAKELVELVLSYFLNTTISSDTTLFWSQTDSPGPGWTSTRYGVSGILRFLAAASSYWEVDESIFQRALEWILDQRDEYGDIPISPGSYFTSGREYGEAGIAFDFLKVYQYLGYDEFLRAAEDIVNHLIAKSEVQGDKLSLLWTFIGEGTEFEGLYLKSLDTGIAGVLDLFIELYQTTLNSSYMGYADKMVNYLIAEDKGGYWLDSSVGYVTRSSNNNGVLGYMSGSMGIASVLMRYMKVTNDYSYISNVARVEKLISKVTDVEKIPLSLEEETYYYGLRLGSVGLGLFYLELYNYLGLKDRLEKADEIIDILVNKYKENGHFLVMENGKQEYSVNLEEGSSGLGMLLLKRMNATSDQLVSKYYELYDSVDPTTSVSSLYPNWILSVVCIIIYNKRTKLQVFSS